MREGGTNDTTRTTTPTMEERMEEERVEERGLQEEEKEGSEDEGGWGRTGWREKGKGQVDEASTNLDKTDSMHDSNSDKPTFDVPINDEHSQCVSQYWIPGLCGHWGKNERHALSYRKEDKNPVMMNHIKVRSTGCNTSKLGF
ncbi:hypothetical protein PDE_04841 [Penicillium oxalicum 114-2]|uniref:Uncharacterized protein n=1 Tax=Penicillium oxalicum (strain 114-2 / CGMCC 5302) TaxID=933388 RepID=S7ZMJ6_PENO1|nr:hypothetical protein PDE_04841 [Penicillium oxalicum 114-2]